MFSSKSQIKNGRTYHSKRSRCRSCTNEDNLLRYHNKTSTQLAHREASYRYRIRAYGLSVDKYNKMVEEQDNKCFICENPDPKKLCIDHCHQTGKIRKLLCQLCNKALGHARDDIEILKKLINYLEIHNA